MKRPKKTLTEVTVEADNGGRPTFRFSALGTMLNSAFLLIGIAETGKVGVFTILSFAFSELQ